jgi:hypothetical protein
MEADMRERKRLDVVNDLGKFMAVFGWVTVGMSALLGVVSMGALAEGTSRQSGVVLGVLIILVGAVSGIMMAAMGHVMQYLVESKRGAENAAAEVEHAEDDFGLSHSVPA